MRILSISTSSDICSVALLENNKILKEISVDDKKTHSENLMPLIKRIFDETNTVLSSVDLIGCSIGPGSFTGIRIGISTTKALAEVLKVPVVGVTSLEGLVHNTSLFNGNIVALIDAKNNNTYCGIFDRNFNLLQDYLAEDIDTVLKHAYKYKINTLFIGDGALAYEKQITKKFGAEAYFAPTEKNKESAASIGTAAYIKFTQGITDDADTLSPLYLRKSQAERMKENNDNNK